MIRKVEERNYRALRFCLESRRRCLKERVRNHLLIILIHSTMSSEERGKGFAHLNLWCGRKGRDDDDKISHNFFSLANLIFSNAFLSFSHFSRLRERYQK
jgi:hypothetical protein